MNPFLLALPLILGVSIVLGLSTLIVSYSVHRSQVLSFCSEVRTGNFRDFLKEFDKYQWIPSFRWGFSLFDRRDPKLENQIHASILEFGNVGMMLDFVSWLKFLLWNQDKKKFYRKLNPRIIRKWSK